MQRRTSDVEEICDSPEAEDKARHRSFGAVLGSSIGDSELAGLTEMSAQSVLVLSSGGWRYGRATFFQRSKLTPKMTVAPC
jgi:hypothetical protein